MTRHDEDEVSKRCCHDDKKPERQEIGDLTVPLSNTILTDGFVESRENDGGTSLSVDVEKALRKLSLIEDCSSTLNSACCSTDMKEISSFSKLSLAEAADESHISDSHIFEGLDE